MSANNTPNSKTSASPTSVAANLDVPLITPFLLPPKTGWEIVTPSAKSSRTRNPIRAIIDPIVASIQSGSERGDGKDPISLALGDPTAAGNLYPCPVAIPAVLDALQNVSQGGAAAGYINACGLPAARQAVAEFHNVGDANHVVIANGCSGALELALTALLDDDSVLLVPQPGFPLYQVIAESHGASVAHYRLQHDRDWECDLEHVEELLSEYGGRVKGVVINNPSNPTGAVFSYEHLRDILTVCENWRIPVIADEVYGDLTFQGHKFYPMAEVSEDMGRTVPVITASGIGKQFLLPGWRVGWIVFHDNVHGSLREVEAGAKRLAQVILGASHLAQTAVPALLQKDDLLIQDWKKKLCMQLEKQAYFLGAELALASGLEVLPAGGAMYMMVRIDQGRFDSINNDIEFAKLLLEEENVIVLPGSCFGVPRVFRAVFCAPTPVLEEAANRIRQFCDRHSN